MTFVMMTSLSSETLQSPKSIEDREKDVMRHIRDECPEVKWQHSYAVLGPYEYIDIFEAPDIQTAQKVALLTRTYGHANAQVLPATEWSNYKAVLHSVKAA